MIATFESPTHCEVVLRKKDYLRPEYQVLFTHPNCQIEMLEKDLVEIKIANMFEDSVYTDFLSLAEAQTIPHDTTCHYPSGTRKVFVYRPGQEIDEFAYDLLPNNKPYINNWYIDLVVSDNGMNDTEKIAKLARWLKFGPDFAPLEDYDETAMISIRKCVEWCQHCDTEQEIKETLEPQTCPGCGAPIMACTYCHDINNDSCDWRWDDETRTTGHCRFNKENNL
jgi:predicted RNA-binding Zn-ribbon protein involved in translation (DUF1610 family)